VTQLILTAVEETSRTPRDRASVRLLASAAKVRAFPADAMERGRLGLAELIQHLDPVADGDRARAVGGLYHAILSGLLLQWLTDPDRAPTGRELATGMRLVLGDLSMAGTSSTRGSSQST